jgi:nicotinate-nucleotide pyrophosphorylase
MYKNMCGRQVDPDFTEKQLVPEIQKAALSLIKCEAAVHAGNPEAEAAFDDLSANLKFEISNNMFLVKGTIILRECAKQFDLAILAAHESTQQRYCY